jgi:hypothetical protein
MSSRFQDVASPSSLSPLFQCCLPGAFVVSSVRPFWVFSWDGMRLSPLGMSATNWHVVLSPDDWWWWMWSSQRNDNWQGKRKYSLPQCHSVHHKSHMTWLGLEPGLLWWEAGD